MSVFRVVKSDNFTILLNDTLRDTRLSLEATGLLVRLLSRPSDWMVRFESLRRESQVGRDKLRRILVELAKAGYLVRRRDRCTNGKFRWITEVHEVPQASDGKSVSGARAIDVETVDGKCTDIQIQKEQRNTTTTRGGRRGVLGDLVWPGGMSKAEIQSARETLSSVGEDAQMILDVLQAAIAAGEIRKSRFAYLKALVARHHKGEFDPTPGRPVAEARERGRRRSRFTEVPNTEAVLRQHARLLKQDEDRYLQRHKSSQLKASGMGQVFKKDVVHQGGQP